MELKATHSVHSSTGLWKAIIPVISRSASLYSPWRMEPWASLPLDPGGVSYTLPSSHKLLAFHLYLSASPPSYYLLPLLATRPSSSSHPIQCSFLSLKVISLSPFHPSFLSSTWLSLSLSLSPNTLNCFSTPLPSLPPNCPPSGHRELWPSWNGVPVGVIVLKACSPLSFSERLGDF